MQRTERSRRPSSEATYAWLVDSTAMVNHFHFYVVGGNLGPFFLKFCSYFLYNGKLSINGHEYLKRQLMKRSDRQRRIDTIGQTVPTRGPCQIQLQIRDLSASLR